MLVQREDPKPMYLPKMLPLVVSAALACTLAMYGANQKSVKSAQQLSPKQPRTGARLRQPS
jgi:hypothetical protein